MTKKEAKTTIHLRGGTSWLDQDSNKVGAYYTPAQRRILCLLVDKTPANGKKWQEFDVTQGRCSTRVGRLIFEAEVTEKTFYTALKKFDERGDVIVHVATGSCGQNEYTVVLNGLKEVRTDTARKKRNRNKDRHRPGYWKDRWQKIKQPLDA